MLDLAAQAIDLHVNGTLPDRAVSAGERLPCDRVTGCCGEQAQHFALPIGEPHDLLAAFEFAADEMEPELTEAHRFRYRSGGRAAAA